MAKDSFDYVDFRCNTCIDRGEEHCPHYPAPKVDPDKAIRLFLEAHEKAMNEVDQ